MTEAGVKSSSQEMIFIIQLPNLGLNKDFFSAAQPPERSEPGTRRLATAYSAALPVAPVAPVATSVPSKGTTVPPVAPTCGEASRCAAGCADEAEPALRTGYTTTRACTPQDRATALPLRCHTEPPRRGPGRAPFCHPSSVPDAVFHTFR